MGRREDLPHLARLLELKGSIAFGLERTQAFQELLGNPHRAYKTIHVAGTNGKGSVSHKLAASLQAAGYKTGLYTSPHIFDVTERIQIDGKPISPDLLEKHLAKIPPGGSFFETITSAALDLFAAEGVDWAVIETGMGGRLDPTNIIAPELAIITSIGFDHAEHLGSTLQEIAQEKGAIAKPGIPLIIGPTVPLEGMRVAGPFPTYLHENNAIAKRACDHLKIPFVNIQPPFRFERHGSLILDAAHNPPGLRRLFEAVNHYYPGQRPHVIAGFSRDAAKSLPIVEAHAKTFQLVDLKNPIFEIPKELTVITGSFYLMPAAVKAVSVRGQLLGD